MVVVGGGPAGSTAAAVLAAHGRRVLLLERETFPRYHVGESLIPYCYFPLARIGMIEKLKASHFPKKYAVQFVTAEGKVSAPFYFFQHLDHQASMTWQVRRSEFDRMLLENAVEKGAKVRMATEAMDFLRRHGRVAGVVAKGPGGRRIEVPAAATIDASGRSGLALTRNQWRRRDPRLNKVAVWTYFRGALRDEGIDEGTTTVAYLPRKGWFWYIPLPEDTVGVGIVAEKDDLFDASSQTNDLAEVFGRQVTNNRWISRHLAPGRQFGKYHATRDFSYRAEHCAEDGLVLAGDALAFLDPVFSSGVYLALRGGEMAGDAVHQALAGEDVSAERFRDYSDRLRAEIDTMRKLVYAFYEKTFSFGRLLKSHPEIRGDLTDCLIGNLQKDFTAMFAVVEEFAQVARPLVYGGPAAGE